MSSMPMSEMLQFIQARRAGHTSESMLQNRIEEHQDTLAMHAQQTAESILKQVVDNNVTSESLNDMIEQANPTENAQEQLASLKKKSDQLKSVSDQVTKDLEVVKDDLHAQEQTKVSSIVHLNQLREILLNGKKKNTVLSCFYEVGDRVSQSIVQKVTSTEVSSPMQPGKQ